ncbi:MAG: GMP/IMP nucleotidase [Cocleimonas sp.]|nr:GMP/IMP nucleotidase [Cocleimonas sp.]
MLNKIPMDWQNIHTVFLDMDGTLLDLHYDNHFWLDYVPKCYAEKHQLKPEETKDLLASRYGKIQGTLNWYCLDHWSEQLGLDIPALKQDVAERIKIRTNVKPFLEFLQQQNKHIILLTNAHPKTVAIKFQHVAIEKYFDKIITSHDIGMAKEEDGFWDKLQQGLDFKCENSLFIDDSLSVLRAAQRHNIAHLLAIHQPDSQQQAIDTEEFTALECFRQLF